MIRFCMGTRQLRATGANLLRLMLLVALLSPSSVNAATPPSGRGGAELPVFEAPPAPTPTTPPNAQAPGPGDHALVILSTDDLPTFQAVVALAQQQRGDVVLGFPPGAFIAALSPAAEAEVRQHPAVARIERGVVDITTVPPQRESVVAAVDSWNAAYRKIVRADRRRPR